MTTELAIAAPIGTILAIDDDPGSLILAEEVFSQEGYRVETALSGVDALGRIAAIQPDIVLLDIVMPELDGYEVCRQIKAMPQFKNTPIIMLTGREDIETVERAYNIGAWDFTPKPINWPILKYRVRHALQASIAFTAERSAARLSRAIDNSPSEVFVYDASSLQIVGANVSALKNLGYREEELTQTTLATLVKDSTVESLSRQMSVVKRDHQAKLNFDLARKDGSDYPAEGMVLYSDDEEPSTFIGIFQDISEKKRVEKELHRLAFYDELTGLPNRRLLEEHVIQALAVAERRNGRCAICMLDLDGFKIINDTLGHSVGDLVLMEVSNRLSGIIRQYDLVARQSFADLDQSGMQLARLGGDEFMLLLTEFTDPKAPATIALRILRQIALPYEVHRTELSLTASLGIALYPDDGDNYDTLMMRADNAMYNAKKSGKNKYTFYREENDNSSVDRFHLEAELRAALKQDEFELHYQPQLDSSLERIVGAECLLRWRHPDGELRYPQHFIPLAEETGMILAIGDWVMREAVKQQGAWAAKMPTDFKVSVNVSSLQLRQDSFLQVTRELLHANPAAYGNLVIELTESSLMTDAEGGITWLQEMQRAGVRIAIDDFGTGYSSLSYLKKFPIDYLKIDRSFVVDVETDREDTAIVTAIFRLAQALDIEIIVEGVETRSQLDVLASMGDCLIQGWLISKALPAEQFEAFFEQYQQPLVAVI